MGTVLIKTAKHICNLPSIFVILRPARFLPRTLQADSEIPPRNFFPTLQNTRGRDAPLHRFLANDSDTFMTLRICLPFMFDFLQSGAKEKLTFPFSDLLPKM